MLALADPVLSCTGVETSNGVVHRLIPRHSILPRRVETTFTTTEDNRELARLLTNLMVGRADPRLDTESAASLRLFEGEFPAEGNRLLGVLELDGLTPAPAGDLELLVSLEVSDWYTWAPSPFSSRTANAC